MNDITETRYGLMHVSSEQELISESLRIYGEWAQKEIEHIARFLRDGDTVFDVGACFGTHALAFAGIVGGNGAVTAFEASPANFSILTKNVSSRDGAAPIYAVNAVIASDSAVNYDIVQEINNFGATRVRLSDSQLAPKVARLDDIQCARLDFIKIDVEGMEAEVLSGAKQTLQRLQPIVFFEVNTVAGALSVMGVLEPLSYVFFGDVVSAYNPENFKEAALNIFGEAKECGIFAIPNERFEAWAAVIEDLRLCRIHSADDVALLLLHKPQFLDEVLARCVAAEVFDVPTRVEFASDQNQQDEVIDDSSEPDDKGGDEGGEISDQEQSLEVLNVPTRVEFASDQNQQDEVIDDSSEPDDKGGDEGGEISDQEQSSPVAREIRTTPGAPLNEPRSGSNRLHAAVHRLAFHSNKRPRGWVRFLLVKDKDGTPRKLTRRVLIKKSGRVRPVFRDWYSRYAPIDAPSPHITEQRRRRVRDVPRIAPPEAPSKAEWAALKPAGGIIAPAPVIDVIVPVYRGFAETMRCLYSAIKEEQQTPFRLIVVDDCSPDADLSVALQELGKRSLITLLRNTKNLGFVGSCNRAMQLHKDRDVVLLNSDTEVYGDWLDRIARRARETPNAGTITPFSNNATICSYPYFAEDNFQELEVDGRELDRLASISCDALPMKEIPTGVGFCMYVRRLSLNVVGLLDEQTFGRGYGEENDLCQRIAKKGWKNYLAPDVYVTHYGAVSFGEEEDSGKQAALAKMLQLHPNYRIDVDDFICKDPVLPLRRRVDEARLARVLASADGKRLLYIAHNHGGGTEKHVQEMRAAIEKAGGVVLIARPDTLVLGRFAVEAPSEIDLPNLSVFSCSDDVGVFADFLKRVGISHVHIHHLLEYGPDAPIYFRNLARHDGFRVDFTLHDYFSICPRINLIDGSGRYCGEPDVSVCQSCVEQNGSFLPEPSNAYVWRHQNLELLENVKALFAPDQDVADRIKKYVKRPDVLIREHATSASLIDALTAPGSDVRVQAMVERKKRRIGVLGAIGPHKGSALLLRTAEAARKLGLPIEFSVIGYTSINRELEAIGNVTIAGRYSESEVLNAVRAQAPDLLFIPSVWPETFCYTLTEAVAAGVQPVVFDFGAPARRIKEMGWGTCIPLDLLDDPEGVARFLTGCEIIPRSETARASMVRVLGDVEEYYDPLT